MALTQNGQVKLGGIPAALVDTKAAIPLVGLGTWKADPGVVGETVRKAIELGYGHIDCAKAYKNEGEVGEALKKVFEEGAVAREQLWITTKLWNSDHEPHRVVEAAKESLQKLQISYLDNYLMHWPVTGNKGDKLDPPIKDTWQAMERLVEEGLVRCIGVSNFSIKKLKELLSYAKIKPAINQIEVHPFWRNDNLINFCHEQGIHVTAYSPLGSPDSAEMMKRENSPSPLKDETVERVAKKLGKAPAQVLVRWAIQHGTSVIPKSTSESHLKSNLDVLSWEIPAEDFEAISSIKLQSRMVDGTMFTSEEGPYKKPSDIWDE